MNKLYGWIMSSLRSDEGATMVEYGIMVSVIAMVVIVAATALGVEISDLFNRIVL